ncbi:MAG: GntR family transcriptional regulator, partial [Burkholderiales bacterium]
MRWSPPRCWGSINTAPASCHLKNPLETALENLYDDPITVLHSPVSVQASPASGPLLLVTERLSDRLALRLGAQIESGQLAPGDRLPTEQQLAAAHGVSRTVVREAMHQLKSRALVVARQGSGVFVAPKPVNQPL